MRAKSMIPASETRRAMLTRLRADPLWLVLPALLVLLAVYVAPLFNMLRYSFYESSTTEIVGDDLTLSHYINFVTDTFFLTVLLRTLFIAGMATILTLIIGYPLGWVMARGPARLQGPLLMIVLLPLMVSVVIRSFGWTIILGLDGPVNDVLISLQLIDLPLKLLYNQIGVVIGLTYVYMPFMVLPLSNVLAKIDPEVEAAASTLGASGLQTFRRVILPLSIPGIAAGSVLVFTLSMSAYVTPALLGGAGVQVMTTFVAQQILVILNWPLGSTIAAVLMFIVVAIVASYNRWLESRTKFYRGADR